jgi:hypothetical protein
MARRARAALVLYCWALAVALLAAGADVRAAAADQPGFAEHRTVRLVVLGSAEEAAALRASLGELLGRIAVDLAPANDPLGSVPEVAGAPAVVNAEIDLREPGVAVVRVGANGTPRRVPQRASRAVLLEEAALVVYTASESLFEEARTGPAEPAAAPPLPLPSPAPVVVVPAPAAPARVVDRPPPRVSEENARTPWVLEGAMLASVRAYTKDQSTVTGFGLGMRTHVGASRFVPAVWLLGQFFFPFKTSSDSVELSTSVWSVRLEPSVELVRSGAFRLEVALGGGVDIFVAAPVLSNPQATGSDSENHPSGVLATLVAGSLTTTRTSRLVLAATLDYDLQPRRYVVAQGETRTVILEPWQFRPGLSLGFLFDMAGTGAEP